MYMKMGADLEEYNLYTHANSKRVFWKLWETKLHSTSEHGEPVYDKE